jgi:hypothetical protein
MLPEKNQLKEKRMKLIKVLVGLTAVLALTLAPISAQEYGVTYTRYNARITTATTTTPVSKTAQVYTIVINVTGTPTSETITIQNKEGTPKILYASAALSAASASPIVIAVPVGFQMTSGIDIITGGTVGTGVVNVWITYR